MTAATKKSFARIRDDYAFFAAHTTEFDQDPSRTALAIFRFWLRHRHIYFPVSSGHLYLFKIREQNTRTVFLY